MLKSILGLGKSALTININKSFQPKFNFIKSKFSTFSNNSNSNEASSCSKQNCGCHSTPQDDLERDLKSKNYKIIECINLGKYDEALDLSDDFINTIKTNFGDDHPFYCSALNNKAFILKTCGEFDEAKIIFDEVTEKYRTLYGENNEKVIITLHNLATLHKDNKEYEKSLEIYEKILKIIERENINIEQEKTGNLRLNVIANIYNSAGGLYRQIKNFKEGDRLLSLSYNIIKVNFGENTLPISTILNNMALSLKDQARYEEAMEKYNTALKIKLDLLDKDHPDIIMLRHNIVQLKNEMAENLNNKI
jgi:tetratricopeptide (TPR) repeat protein